MRPIIFNETWLSSQAGLTDETAAQARNMTFFFLAGMKEGILSIKGNLNGDMFYIIDFAQVGI